MRIMRWYLTQHVVHNIRTASSTWRARTGSTRPAKSLSAPGGIDLGALKVPKGPLMLLMVKQQSPYKRILLSPYISNWKKPTEYSFCKGKYCSATYHEFRRCRGKQVHKLRSCRPGFSDSLWQGFLPKDTEEMLLELNWEKGHVNWKMLQGKI